MSIPWSVAAIHGVSVEPPDQNERPDQAGPQGVLGAAAAGRRDLHPGHGVTAPSRPKQTQDTPGGRPGEEHKASVAADGD